jgi:CO/xanthine dehydrogenase Mo-binding subunit
LACRAVINPRSLHGQLLGGSCLGIGHALTQRWSYDRQYGVPLAKRFHYNKPLTILDIPPTMATEALNLPDPETPVIHPSLGDNLAFERNHNAGAVDAAFASSDEVVEAEFF